MNSDIKKIMIIGFSGAGKSTLACELANRLGILPTHLDSLHWLRGWKEDTLENKIKKLSPVLERDSWVIDGNYSNLLYIQRIDDADMIIYLDFNRFLCFKRTVLRTIKYRGQSRPDMTEGCPDKMDFEFAKWVLYGGRKKREKTLRMLDDVKQIYPEKQVYILKRPKQVEEFLNTL